MGHIKTKNTVCLEPFLLEDRISSVTLESSLRTCHEHEQKLFAERHNFDLAVYYGHDSEIMHKNSVTNLVQAIFENDYVFFVGGFVAWEQLTGEGGVEQITNFVTHNTNYDSTQNGYVKEISGIKPSRPLTRNRDRFKRNGKTFNINPNRTSIILKHFRFCNINNLVTHHPIDSTLFNDLTNNMSSKPKVTAPNRPLPRPIPNVSNNSDNSSINQPGSRLQRRKAIFDFPYHGFSEIPPVQQTLPSVTPNNNPVQMKVYRPEYSHTYEGSFSQMGSGIGTTGLRNLGNTCFRIQFSNFLDGSFKRHINRDNHLGAKGELADKFATLIRVMWSDQYVSPVTFKEAIG
ncbi:cysteine proteinase [Gigaspora margarita]|uniref:Cysteine proteinase n=1 Tax=Gigaspora margarita TaxID=4874 RepID=A0A8H4B1L6_GIGMA|nr:cysteine proteinase [Gigaspora margarita]